MHKELATKRFLMVVWVAFVACLALGLADPIELGPLACSLSEDTIVGSAVCGSFATDLNAAIQSLPGYSPPHVILSSQLTPTYLGYPVPFTLHDYTAIVLSSALDREAFDDYVLLFTMTSFGPYWSTNFTVTLNISVTNVMEPPVWVYSSPLLLNVSQSSAFVEVCARPLRFNGLMFSNHFDCVLACPCFAAASQFGPSLSQAISDTELATLGSTVPPWSSVSIVAYPCACVDVASFAPVPDSPINSVIYFNGTSFRLGAGSLGLASAQPNVCVLGTSSISGLSAGLDITLLFVLPPVSGLLQ